MTENDIEEIIRNSIEMICDEEESMLIVGKQVKNEKNGISDLTAVHKETGKTLSQIREEQMARKEMENSEV